jgi:hypothetical protein
MILASKGGHHEVKWVYTMRIRNVPTFFSRWSRIMMPLKNKLLGIASCLVTIRNISSAWTNRWRKMPNISGQEGFEFLKTLGLYSARCAHFSIGPAGDFRQDWIQYTILIDGANLMTIYIVLNQRRSTLPNFDTIIGFVTICECGSIKWVYLFIVLTTLCIKMITEYCTITRDHNID